ncbi:MAG: hypothetical protein WC091_24400 [Sulfuricellaceae bacterium]
MVLNNFVIYFAFTRMVRALRAGLHGFPGAWRRCNYKRREWNKPFFVVAPLVPRPSGRRVCPAPGKPHTPARSTELSRIMPMREKRENHLHFSITAAKKPSVP